MRFLTHDKKPCIWNDKIAGFQGETKRHVMIGSHGCASSLKRDVDLSDYISVKEYGAVGDGVTDDRIAIHNAIADAKQNGKNVRFPAGKYFVGNYISVNRDGVDIYCDPMGCEFFGTGSYIIQFSAGNIHAYFNGSVLHGRDLISHTLSCSGQACHNVDIYDVVIEGTSYDHDGIYIGSNASYVSIYGGSISGASRCGIAVCDAKHTVIDGVNISDVKRGSVAAGIDIEANHYNANEDNIVRNCIISDCERSGISVSWGTQTRIENNKIMHVGGTGIVSGISGAQWKDPARIGYDKMFVSNFDEDGFITLDAADDAVIEIGAWMRFHCDENFSPPPGLSNLGYYNICEIDPDNPKKVRIGSHIGYGVITAIPNPPNPDRHYFFNVQNPDQGSNLVIRGNVIDDAALSTTAYGIDIRGIMRVKIDHNIIRRTKHNSAIAASSYQSIVEYNTIEDVVGYGISVSTESLYNNNTIRRCTGSPYYIPQYRINNTIQNSICEDVATESTYSVLNISGPGNKLYDCEFHSNRKTLQYGLVVGKNAIDVKLKNIIMDCTTSKSKYYPVKKEDYPEGLEMINCT